MKRIVASLLAGAACCAVAATANAQDAKEFLVGLIGPETGIQAPFAKTYFDGMVPGVKMINDEGGVGGLPVRIVRCDNQSSEVPTVLCAKKLIEQDKVDMLVGAMGTPGTIAMEPTVAAEGIPLMAMAAGRSAYADPVKKWVFKEFYTNDDQIPATLNFIKKKGWSKIAVIVDNTAFGSDSAAAFKTLAAKMGITIVDNETYTVTDTDITAQLTHIRGANPDAIINWALAVGVGGLVGREAVQIGMNTPQFVGMNLQIPAFVQQAGPAAPNMFYTAGLIAVGDMPKDNPLYDNLVKYTKYFTAEYPGQKPISSSPSPVDALIIAQAAGKAIGPKVTDRAALRDAIEAIKNVKGLQGFWSFSPTSHESSLSDGVIIVKSGPDNSWVLQ